MQFEDFDKKLKQAAEQHHPNYDEHAWSRMEKLLDQHLPQKKESRRRFLLILFLFLLTAGGTWLAIDQPWRKDMSATATVAKSKENRSADKSQRSSDAAEPGTISGTGEKSKSAIKSSPGDVTPGEQAAGKQPDNNVNFDTPATPGSSAGNAARGRVDGDSGGMTVESSTPPTRKTKNKSTTVHKKETVRMKLPLVKKLTGNNQQQVAVEPGAIATSGKKQLSARTDDPEISGRTTSNDNQETAVSAKQHIKATTADSSTSVEPPVPGEDIPVAVKTDSLQKETDEAIVPGKVNPAKRSNSLFVSFSAGPDISSVGFTDPGKVQLLTGVGLGYTFKDRWTLRTGFYTASKVYSAKPADYKPSVVPPSIDYLMNISADCKVYEIPVELLYHFGRTAKRNFYAGAGFSSFIMKREEYEYLYQYPGASQTWTYLHTENNKNKHYFSVLSLTAGYEYRVNRLLSLSMAPYLKLPLAGVGYGKVKLNSAGVLVSVKLTPFRGDR